MHQDHPNLSPEINNAIRESELAGGVWWKDLPVNSRVEVQTKNRLYLLEKRDDGDYIQGHPEYCELPTKAHIHGSTFGGSMLKVGWLGVGMYLEFSIPGRQFGHDTITTSQIQDVRQP